MGWGDLKNGVLLRAVESAGFEILVTGDRSFMHEQNLTGRRVAVVALSATNWPIIKSHLPRIVSTIDDALAGSFQEVDCGVFSRKENRR